MSMVSLRKCLIDRSDRVQWGVGEDLGRFLYGCDTIEILDLFRSIDRGIDSRASHNVSISFPCFS